VVIRRRVRNFFLSPSAGWERGNTSWIKKVCLKAGGLVRGKPQGGEAVGDSWLFPVENSHSKSFLRKGAVVENQDKSFGVVEKACHVQQSSLKQHHLKI